MVFRGYLRAQEVVAVHILWFRSTHQYYRTVEYELNRTTGGGDNEGTTFCLTVSMNQHHCLDTVTGACANTYRSHWNLTNI